MGTKLDGAEIFKAMGIDPAGLAGDPAFTPLNLMAYDGAGRIFVWNPQQRHLHSLQIVDSDLGDQPECLYAASESKILKLSVEISFPVRSLKLNRTGQLLLLAGDRALCFVNVVPQASQLCRSQMIAGKMFNGRSLRILHAAWHPYSETHIGVLSSDGVFRLFNLSGDLSVAEQEYHLQIGDRSRPLCRPVSFAFGAEHFWDRFAVFILLSDASIYALCPIVPFGSLHYGASLKDLLGQLSNTSASALKESSRLAAVWLEIVFPELGDAEKELGTTSVFRARSQVLFNASLVLQGPLPKLSGPENGEKKIASYATQMLYNTAGKDSIITVCTKNGELYFYAIADEVHPMWNVNNIPKLIQDDLGDVRSLAMLVEPGSEKVDGEKIPEDTVDDDDDYVGPNPPLLHLASVDLALETEVYSASPLGIFLDPLVPERIYCHHAMGLDTIQLQWLPFSDAFAGESREQPNVFPVLDTSASGNSNPVPLLGSTVILQSSGVTWLIALTASGNCAVVHMKPHRTLAPVSIDDANLPAANSDQASVIKLISSDLLLGPKNIPIPVISASTPLTLETVEGRSVLHDQGKLLHEKYIEYAHRVHVDLKSHHKYLGHVVQDLDKHLRRVTNELDRAEGDLDNFVDRIHRAFEKNMELQDRIRECNKLPALRQKVLTVAERELNDLLETKMSQDVEILQSAVESLTLRAHSLAKPKVTNNIAGRRRSSPKVSVSDTKMRSLRQAMDKLGQHLELSSRRIDILDQTVKRKENQLEC